MCKEVTQLPHQQGLFADTSNMYQCVNDGTKLYASPVCIAAYKAQNMQKN